MGILIAIGVGFLLLVIILVVVVSKNAVSGTCPNCKAPLNLFKPYGACQNCNQGVRFENGEFVPLEPGFVSEYPAFNTNLSKLKHPSQWSVIWPGRCCVCGRPAVRQDNIKIKSVEGQAGSALAPTNITETTKFEVGYCAAHKDGMRYLYPPGVANAKSNKQCLLAVRSFDYYREFMKNNGK